MDSLDKSDRFAHREPSALFVTSAYKFYLNKKPDANEIGRFSARLMDGVPAKDVLQEVRESEPNLSCAGVAGFPGPDADLNRLSQQGRRVYFLMKAFTVSEHAADAK